MTIKTHWHAHNPWADSVVYVPIEELAACHYSLGQLITIGYRREPMTVESTLSMWTRAGANVDAYILPSPSGEHCIGVRYGKEGSQYLSPMGNQKKVSRLLAKATKYTPQH